MYYLINIGKSSWFQGLIFVVSGVKSSWFQRQLFVVSGVNARVFLTFQGLIIISRAIRGFRGLDFVVSGA
jgi:hypothetical protein